MTGSARARQLLTEAESIARTVAYPSVGHPSGFQSWALREIVRPLSRLDPDDAERLARTIATPRDQAEALNDVASALVNAQPDRARRLFTDAERAAEHNLTYIPIREGTLPSYTGERDRALVVICSSLAPLDIADAERVARTIDGREWKVSALHAIAETSIASDPRRARRLLTEAEHLARTGGFHPLGYVLGEVAGTRARLDRHTAERIARGISDEYAQGRALREIVRNLAETDPHHAEGITAHITNPIRRAQAITLIAAALAKTEPGRARRSLADAADLLLTSDTRHPWLQARTLTKIAAAAVQPDPALARTLLTEAERIPCPHYQAAVLLEDMAEAMARLDRAEAERISHSIAQPPVHRLNALRKIGRVIVADDPDHAERIALELPRPHHQARAMAGMAMALIEQATPEALTA
ncbi:hypothetical protein AB0C21_05255 [Spirillospora sp. NPDC049024]